MTDERRGEPDLDFGVWILLLSTVMNDDFISLRLTIPGRLRPVLYTLMLSVQPACMKQELVDLTLLIHGIVASGQCKLALRTQTVPASTVLTNRF
jgi:hypothetical protein